MKTIQVITILLITYSITCVAHNSCISPHNKQVDWSIIYLLPKNGEEMDFLYMDDTMKDFTTLKATEKNFPPVTLTASLTSTQNYVIWNDDQTNGDHKPEYNFHVAHSKGVLAFDNKNGFYMIHSLPRFPLRTEAGKIEAKFASNVGQYGQIFFCMSIDISEVESILDALLTVKPMVILHNLSKTHSTDTLHKKIEELANLFKHKAESNEKEFTQNSRTEKKKKITTLQGLEVDLFMKTKDMELPWNKDIPSFYKDNFYVETWTRPHLLPSLCSTHSVYVVEEMNFGGIEMVNTKDHSKWGVSETSDVICYGDINRTQEQEVRTGTVACFKNEIVAKMVRKFIKKSETCSKLSFLS